MAGLTYKEWYVSVWQAYAEHVKANGVEGSQFAHQFIPNHLSEVRPDIYNELRDTDFDCYHTGDFAQYLNQVLYLWNRPKTFSIETHKGLIAKLASQVEYGEGPRYNTKRDWFADVSGCDTHGQARLSDDEEDLLRQIKRYPR